MSIQQMLLSAGTNYASVDSAQFDGTNDYMARGGSLTGVVDGKKGIISFWIRLDGGDSVSKVLLNGPGIASRVFVSRTSGNKFFIQMANSSNTVILSISTVATYLASATWHHFLASWDLGTAGQRFIYVDDVADLAVTTFTDDTIDYTNPSTPEYLIGGSPSVGDRLNGCLAEYYFNTVASLDLSVASNRRLFIGPNLKPVYLGADGSLPTGTAPAVYSHLAKAEAPANFALNRGTGGDFSVVGTLTTGSTSPN